MQTPALLQSRETGIAVIAGLAAARGETEGTLDDGRHLLRHQGSKDAIPGTPKTRIVAGGIMTATRP